MNKLKSNLIVKVVAFVLLVVVTFTSLAGAATVVYLAANEAYALNSPFTSENMLKELAENDFENKVVLVANQKLLFNKHFYNYYYDLLDETNTNFLYEVRDKNGNVIATNLKDGEKIAGEMDYSQKLSNRLEPDWIDEIRFRTEAEAKEYLKYCSRYFSSLDYEIIKHDFYYSDSGEDENWETNNWYHDLFKNEEETETNSSVIEPTTTLPYGDSFDPEEYIPVEIKTDKDGDRYYEAYKIVVNGWAADEDNLVCTIGWREQMTAYDEYYFAITFVDKLNESKYSLFGLIAITALLSIILFCFLISSAGHKSGVEGIYLNLFNKIPYDIMLALIGFAVFGLVYLFDVGIAFSFDDPVSIALLVATVLGIIIVFPIFFMTTAARIKGRTFHKNWLIIIIPKYFFKACKKISQKLGKAFRKTADAIPFYWQAGFGILIWFVADIILCCIFCAWGFDDEIDVVAMVLIKLLIIPVIALAVINMKAIEKGGEEISGGNLSYKINTNIMYPPFRKHAERLNDIGSGLDKALDEKLKSERMKTELITNVSHDIKTPLTSIINYVDLLKREGLGSPNAAAYLEVIDRQSARLKKLTVDLVEMSKATTGNINVNITDVDVNVLLTQAVGEYSEKLQAKGLEAVVSLKEDMPQIKADGNLLWRIFDNLLSNICKYAKYDTRVYLETALQGNEVKITFKNISNQPLNIPGEELMERFVRGDSSRNTEGSGLGLSIAQSLAKIQNADFKIDIDGDLFKSVISFKI